MVNRKPPTVRPHRTSIVDQAEALLRASQRAFPPGATPASTTTTDTVHAAGPALRALSPEEAARDASLLRRRGKLDATAPSHYIQHEASVPFEAATLSPREMARFPYVAFGSNLNRRQMAWRCPLSREMGPGALPDFRLEFRRVADVVFSPGDETPIGLWRVTRDCVQALDRYEGFPRVYTRQFVRVDTDTGPVWAFVYVMTGCAIEPPTPQYYDTVRLGYKHFGLPLEPLEAAYRRSFNANWPRVVRGRTK